MRNFILVLLLLLSLNGCAALSLSDEALMREIRQGLVESTRPTLVEALNFARDEDGMIDALRTERVKTVDQMIRSIDRIYPPVDDEDKPTPYEAAPIPWTLGVD